MGKNYNFEQIYTFLQYTNHCRLICNKLGKNILFTTQISFTAEEHQEIAEICSILDGGIRGDNHQASPIKATFVINHNNRLFLKERFKTTNVRFWQDVGDYIHLFKDKIQLPPKLITLNSVLPTFLFDNIDIISDGDEVELLMEPMDGYEYFIEYKNNE